MDIVKTISEKIYDLRKERGITQDALAAALGVTYQAVSKWENALACPDVTMLPKIAEYFGISIAELFGEDAGKASDTQQYTFEADKNWRDDNTLHAVLFRGRTMISAKKLTAEEKAVADKVVLSYEGNSGDIISEFNVEISGNVSGDIVGTGAKVNVEGNAEGDIVGTGATVNVGRVHGDIVGANATITVQGDVEGDIVGAKNVNISGTVRGKIEIDGESIQKVVNNAKENVLSALSSMPDIAKAVNNAVSDAISGAHIDTDIDDSDFENLDEISEKLHDFLDEIDDLRDELEDLSDELEELNDELEELEDESEDLADELSDLADELADAESDDERESIIEEMNSKKEEICDLNSDIEEKKNEISAKRDEIAAKKDEIAAVKENLKK